MINKPDTVLKMFPAQKRIFDEIMNSELNRTRVILLIPRHAGKAWLKKAIEEEKNAFCKYEKEN